MGARAGRPLAGGRPGRLCPTLERRFKYDVDKRRARANLDRADSDEVVWVTAVVPQGVQPPACPVGAGQYVCTDAGLARARPLGVSEVESGGEATVGPSCGIHLNVWKHFSLVAARVAESCLPPCGGGGLLAFAS